MVAAGCLGAAVGLPATFEGWQRAPQSRNLCNRAIARAIPARLSTALRTSIKTIPTSERRGSGEKRRPRRAARRGQDGFINDEARFNPGAAGSVRDCLNRVQFFSRQSRPQEITSVGARRGDRSLIIRIVNAILIGFSGSLSVPKDWLLCSLEASSC